MVCEKCGRSFDETKQDFCGYCKTVHTAKGEAIRDIKGVLCYISKRFGERVLLDRRRTDALIADIFSQNVLIPEQAYREFLRKTWTIYENDIINFAREIGVHPGIVLGRLQMEKRVPYNTKMNSLKIKYEVA